VLAGGILEKSQDAEPVIISISRSFGKRAQRPGHEAELQGFLIKELEASMKKESRNGG